jgi:transcriptional regulator with XRE-family HTH domain
MARRPNKTDTSDSGTIAEQLRAWRKASGLTQGELEKNAGLAHNAVSRIEQGEVSPKLDTIEKIARAMAISVEELQFLKPRTSAASNVQDQSISEVAELIATIQEPHRTRVINLVKDLIVMMKGAL